MPHVTQYMQQFTQNYNLFSGNKLTKEVLTRTCHFQSNWNTELVFYFFKRVKHQY